MGEAAISKLGNSGGGGGGLRDGEEIAFSEILYIFGLLNIFLNLGSIFLVVQGVIYKRNQKFATSSQVKKDELNLLALLSKQELNTGFLLQLTAGCIEITSKFKS